MAYEDVEHFQPCAVCGSRRFCFDGRDWRCVKCEPSALSSPIRVELQDKGLPPQGDSGCSRWLSVRRVSGCEITATVSGGHSMDLPQGRVRRDGDGEA